MEETAAKTASQPPNAKATLPAQAYTDPAFFRREMEQIFFRTWQYAGHASQLQRAGDYFSFSIFDQSLFCVLGQDSQVRCFYNVCQHRAHHLVEGSGNRRVLVCPYHAWTYDLTGRLRKAPNDRKVPDFDRSSICLAQVRCEIFCGFIFVNLDDRAPAMAECFPGVEEELRAYVPQIMGLQPIFWNEIEEACNWKVTIENYNECYHCRINHPTFASGVIDPDTYNVLPQGHCLRHTTHSARLERMTYEIDPAANEHATDYSSWYLWPAFSFQVYPGNLLNTYLWRPLSVDRTRVYRGWYTLGGVESDLIYKLAEQDVSTTVAEDIRLVESVQYGLSSRGYKGGPLIVDPETGVNSEHSIETFHDWVREAVGEVG